MSALRLHDIDDTAAFVAAIVNHSGLTLVWHDREDLEQYLLVEAWQLSLKFRDGGISFSTYAGTTLRKRVVDWQRQQNGRQVWKFKHRVYVRPRTELIPLDSDGDRLEQALAERAGDREADRDEALGGLFADRDRRRAQDLAELGLGADSTVA